MSLRVTISRDKNPQQETSRGVWGEGKEKGCVVEFQQSYQRDRLDSGSTLVEVVVRGVIWCIAW